MHWIQILFETDQQQASQLETALNETGALAVSLFDAGDQPLLEPEPGKALLWNNIRVVGLFDAETPTGEIVNQLSARFGDKLPGFKLEILEDKDWVKEWMDQFQPIQFAEKLWICPSWQQPPDPDAANIMLDPGLAFGTGTHATTALCLEWLGTTALDDCSVIDYGCGSGILGIGALLLGCNRLWATDIDPLALETTAENARRNAIDDGQIEISLPQDCRADASDLLLANILAGPLVELAPTLAALVKHQGKIALSGILESQSGQVLNAYRQWFEFDPVVEREGWVLLTGTKVAH